MLKKAARQIQQVGNQQIGRVHHTVPLGVVDFLKTGSTQHSDIFLTGHKNHTRSETLASIFRRGATRFNAEIRKHPVFCGHLRIT